MTKRRPRAAPAAPRAQAPPGPIEIKEGGAYLAEIADLEKYHPAVREDVARALQEVLAGIASNPLYPGGAAGKRLQGVRPCTYKKRAMDSCHDRGKRGSYRFLHHWDRAANRLYLIMIWHLDQFHVPSAKMVAEAIKKAGLA